MTRSSKSIKRGKADQFVDMRVIPMDYYMQYDEKIFAKLSKAGVRHVLLFWLWYEFAPERDHYDVERLTNYLKCAKAYGIRVMVILAGSPAWTPKEWLLRNARWVYNAYQPYPKLLGQTKQQRVWADLQRKADTFTSYWNPDAEAATRGRITFVRKLVEAEGGMLMPWIGSGEFFLPTGMYEAYDVGPRHNWWYDSYAIRSWLDYQATHENPEQLVWLHETQLRITTERLALYSEKWLQCAQLWDLPIYVNTPELSAIFAANSAGLKRIRFATFQGDEMFYPIEPQYPTWVGCEGPFNLVKNAPIAKAGGASGVLCGLLGLWYGLKTVKPWVCDAIKRALDDWAK